MWTKVSERQPPSLLPQKTLHALPLNPGDGVGGGPGWDTQDQLVSPETYISGVTLITLRVRELYRVRRENSNQECPKLLSLFQVGLAWLQPG